jgi:hypothetical protein
LKTDDTAIADLQALGIDSAELRWFAVRDYLDELRRDGDRAQNALMLVAEFLDLAEQNAQLRGAQLKPGLCECGEIIDNSNIVEHWDYWLCPYPMKVVPTHYLVGNDYLTAQATLLKRFSGKTAERVRKITTEWIPIDIREFIGAVA